jgi:hypothetical protein
MMRNSGGQSAICAGFDRVRGRRAVCIDADLENHPEDVPRLLGIAAVVLVSAGFLGGLLSLVGDYVQRVYQLGQGLPFYVIREDVGAAAEAVEAARSARGTTRWP